MHKKQKQEKTYSLFTNLLIRRLRRSVKCTKKSSISFFTRGKGIPVNCLSK